VVLSAVNDLAIVEEIIQLAAVDLIEGEIKAEIWVALQ
jgi:hypothetical protein